MKSLPETSLGRGASGSTAGEDSAFVLDPQGSDRYKYLGHRSWKQRPGRFHVAQIGVYREGSLGPEDIRVRPPVARWHLFRSPSRVTGRRTVQHSSSWPHVFFV